MLNSLQRPSNIEPTFNIYCVNIASDDHYITSIIVYQALRHRCELTL